MKRALLALLLPAMAQALQLPTAKPPAPVPAVSPLPALPPPPTFSVPEDSRLFSNAPEAGGVTISPADGKIEPFATFSLSFPADIVSPDEIDREGALSPLSVWPPLGASFIWRSPSAGDWMVAGPRIPGQTYRVRLREDLKALDGSSLPIAAWGAALRSDPLQVSSWYDERNQLNALPLVPLEFNAPIRIHDVAEGVWFQDRASRQRFPAQVVLGETPPGQQVPTPVTIRATPRDPLPVGATYDLVVENVFDAYAGRPLPYPRVFPLGTTRPLVVDYVAARNWAAGQPHIEVKFRTALSDAPLPEGAVSVEPGVAGMRLRKDSDTILVDGAFDPSVRYKVTVAPSIPSDRGYPLDAPSVWGATFPAKPPTILFPPGEFRQRAALGLRFALVQCNTGPLTWKLARVPGDQLQSLRATLAKEPAKTAPLLVDSLGLTVVAEGSFKALSNDKEALRAIEARPEAPLAGPYLLEASAATPDGGRIANHALIWFSDLALTQKLSPTELTIRAARMGTGEPVPGVGLQLLTGELLEIASASTGANGLASFPRTASTAAAYFKATSDGVTTLWPASPDGQFSSGSSYHPPRPTLLGKILTDRPLYRPGQDLKIKGLLRTDRDGALKIPAGQSVAWEITRAWQDEVLASGTARINPSGGWDAAWTVPADGALGEFRVVAKLGAEDAGVPAFFRIEEFRNPPFSVLCEPQDPGKPGASELSVSSRYFHGAPNAGARVKWKATWLSDHDGSFYYSGESDGFQQVDVFSEHVKPPVYDAVAEGETALNGDGLATLSSLPPFPDPGNRATATVLWQVDITGPDGQTITGGASDTVTMNALTLGVRESGPPPEGMLRFDLRTLPRNEGDPIPASVPATLFLVKTKTVKEQIAPFVYRYRNFDEFTRIASLSAPANGPVEFPAKDPGRYVLVAGPLPGAIAVSAEATVTGPGESEFPVASDESLTVAPPAVPVRVGEDAEFEVLAPSGGIAWVTVETDRILESRTVEVPGNATKLKIPTRSGFGPNAFVAVYLLRPGGESDIPGEMFGYAGFSVTDPARELALTPSTGKPAYEPREKVTGRVAVTCEGRPVPGAEVAVFAVDDAILELGEWSLPDLAPWFFPPNSFNVITSPALRGLTSGIRPGQLTQKGFIVGDGGDGQFGNVAFTRKDFKPLLFWSPSLKTAPDGTVAFETKAPDNLTRFRVIALAQAGPDQFGSASATFEVTKNLLIEPALPRFLRQGDTIELRAVARQKAADALPLAVRCLTDLKLGGPTSASAPAAKNAPVVFRFPASVPASATTAKIQFDVSAPGGLADSVEISLPVLPRTITVNESTSGTWTGESFAAADFFPPDWTSAEGTFDTALSTSPWLPKLLGLPSILDYPHGCLEQQSSRILAFTALADLLQWLPTNKRRDANYRHTIEQSLKAMEASLLPDGQLPYWPMGTAGSAFVTIQSAFAVSLAEEQGFAVPAHLAERLGAALQAIIARTIPTSPTLRAFALFVAASNGDAEEIRPALDELFIERDRLTNEGKSLLALAFHQADPISAKAAQLVGELPAGPANLEFDPSTFSSPARTAAFEMLARLAVDPASAAPGIRSRLDGLLASSASLSTQENLWLLLTFKALLKSQPASPLARAGKNSLKPAPDASAPNLSAASWSARPLPQASGLTVSGLAKTGAFVLSARRALPASENQPVQKGLRLDRLVKNLTDPSRAGTPEAPFQLGDEILITYRLQSSRPQSFLALEDPLPAGLEVLNTSLFGKFYQPPAEDGVQAASLSHSEIHDSQTSLFFDETPAGLLSHSILARATAAGSFAWPAAQISPMYDSRFYARTAPASCAVQAE